MLLVGKADIRLHISAIDCRLFITICRSMICCLPLVCKGICHRFRITGGGKHSVYELGFKRCSECGIYIKFAGPRCPCCKLPLRTKKRNYVKLSTSVVQ